MTVRIEFDSLDDYAECMHNWFNKAVRRGIKRSKAALYVPPEFVPKKRGKRGPYHKHKTGKAGKYFKNINAKVPLEEAGDDDEG